MKAFLKSLVSFIITGIVVIIAAHFLGGGSNTFFAIWIGIIWARIDIIEDSIKEHR